MNLPLFIASGRMEWHLRCTYCQCGASRQKRGTEAESTRSYLYRVLSKPVDKSSVSCPLLNYRNVEVYFPAQQAHQDWLKKLVGGVNRQQQMMTSSEKDY